jgi:hypothetical protein
MCPDSITIVISREGLELFLETAATSAKNSTVNMWGSVTSVDDQASLTL